MLLRPSSCIENITTLCHLKGAETSFVLRYSENLALLIYEIKFALLVEERNVFRQQKHLERTH